MLLSRYAKTVSRSGFSSKIRSIWYIERPISMTSNFSSPAVREYFAFYSLIRKGTYIWLPDLESTQKCASTDIYIVHIGRVPYTTGNRCKSDPDMDLSQTNLSRWWGPEERISRTKGLGQTNKPPVRRVRDSSNNDDRVYAKSRDEGWEDEYDSCDECDWFVTIANERDIENE